MSSRPPLIKFKNRSNNFTDAEVYQIAYKIGLYWSSSNIINFVKEQFNKKCSYDQILKIRKNDSIKHVIVRAREEFEGEIANVELASKRRRLEELQDIYWKVKKKEKYFDAMMALKQIQMEREGLKSTFELHQYNQYNNWTDEEIRKKLEENRLILEQRKGITHVVENQEVKAG